VLKWKNGGRIAHKSSSEYCQRTFLLLLEKQTWDCHLQNQSYRSWSGAISGIFFPRNTILAWVESNLCWLLLVSHNFATWDEMYDCVEARKMLVG